MPRAWWVAKAGSPDDGCAWTNRPTDLDLATMRAIAGCEVVVTELGDVAADAPPQEGLSMKTVWYSSGSAQRYPIGVPEPTCLRRKIELEEVAERCAQDYFHTHPNTAWPRTITVYESYAGPAVGTLTVEMVMEPAFIAAAGTAPAPPQPATRQPERPGTRRARSRPLAGG